MEANQRRYFLITTLFLTVIVILEFITVAVDGTDAKFRWINILSNFIAFSITPLSIIVISYAIYPKKRLRYFLIGWGIYTLWMLVTTFTGGGVFRVDEENNYYRDSGFFVFIIAYLIGTGILIIENIRYSLQYQSPHNYILLINLLFLLIGTSVQVLVPAIHSTWLTVIIATVFYYIYYDELIQQTDFQTRLFNYNSFMKYMHNQKKDHVLIIFQLDNFKKYQDDFNRTKADAIIEKISTLLSDYYKNIGTSYRIGTDEFCVTTAMTTLDFETLNNSFFREVLRNCYDEDDLPLISIGYAEYKKGNNLNDVLSAADKKRREFIKNRVTLIT